MSAFSVSLLFLDKQPSGKIAETDGKAVAQAFKIDAAAAAGMRLIHGGFFLTYLYHMGVR